MRTLRQLSLKVIHNFAIILIAPGWPGMPLFGDLVQLSTEFPPPVAIVNNPTPAVSQQNFSQQSTVPQPSCLACRSEQEQGISVEVAQRNTAPRRPSTRIIYKSNWSLFEKWSRENLVDFSLPFVIKSLDLFMYLFPELNRCASTIDIYKTTLVDFLGSAGPISLKALN